MLHVLGFHQKRKREQEKDKLNIVNVEMCRYCAKRLVLLMTTPIPSLYWVVRWQLKPVHGWPKMQRKRVNVLVSIVRKILMEEHWLPHVARAVVYAWRLKFVAYWLSFQSRVPRDDILYGKFWMSVFVDYKIMKVSYCWILRNGATWSPMLECLYYAMYLDSIQGRIVLIKFWFLSSIWSVDLSVQDHVKRKYEYSTDNVT